tara:strand:+ start:310 stop:2502 length:2193 start_codon:yes stop_codon:yes gene_type:complete
MTFRGLGRRLKTGLLVCLVVLSTWIGVGLTPSVGYTAVDVDAATISQSADNNTPHFRLEDQPFYADLEIWRHRWDHGYMGQVVDTNPRLSLIKFYSAMARAGQLVRNVADEARTDPGWSWSAESRQKIEEAERLFRSAMQTIDASELPESIRENTQEEAALKLKEILDYVLSNAETLIELPNKTEKGFWRLPGSMIALSSKLQEGADIPYYQFTQRTLDNVDKAYKHVVSVRKPASAGENNTFATPRGYSTYTYTPGYLVPPKAYLLLPQGIRSFLEIPIGEQSLLQVTLTLIVVGIYLPIVGILIYTFLNTFRYVKDFTFGRKGRFWNSENTSWRRFFLIAPIAPLSIFTLQLVDDKINITGWWLRNLDFIFDMLTYVSFGGTIILLFEALGRTGSHWILNFKCSKSDLERKRIQNVLLPICRFLGALTAVLIIYQLLLRLGMPSSTLLAFSAVPGLAIGLGASKLLGNIFAGISIQSDRPFRVGEFCQVGDRLGFVKRIGLRSIELSTLSANVTIPNNKVDDTTIVNFTRQTLFKEAGLQHPLQTIEFHLSLPSGLTIGQLNAITQRSCDYLAGIQSITSHCAHYDESPSGALSLTALAEVRISSWEDYMSIRQSILGDIKLIIAVVKNLKQSISVARDTPLEMVDRIPDLLANIVNNDPNLTMSVCRLSAISDYSLDFMILMESSYTDVGGFFSALARFNKGILDCFAANGIEIPLPTSVEIQKTIS